MQNQYAVGGLWWAVCGVKPPIVSAVIAAAGFFTARRFNSAT
jgi:hypothetical protein